MTTPEMDKILAKYPVNKKEKLLPILQEIQDTFGYLTDEILETVGSHVNLPINKVYGVATFYDQFRFRRRGLYHFQICQGTACYLFGSHNFREELEHQLKVKAGNTSRDGKVSLEVIHCMGACEAAPILKVNDTLYPRISTEELTRIIRSIKEKKE